MKTILLLSIVISITSCSKITLDTRDKAIAYLESHVFTCDYATIKGKNGGSVESGFSISFSNGMAHFNEGDFPYTISERIDGHPGYNFQNFRGYEIKICGSERYAYGGCITAYLSSGVRTNGEREQSGINLNIDGDYIKSYSPETTEGAIKSK